jgi:hypothetical protein
LALPLRSIAMLNTECRAMPEKFYTVQETADRVPCHFNSVYRAIRRNELASVVIGDQRFIAEAEADRFALAWEQRRTGTPWAEFRQWKAERAQRNAAA